MTQTGILTFFQLARIHINLQDCIMATPAQAPTSPPPAQPPAPIVYRGATVWSDITHYALIEDVNQLLETKFPTTADSLGRTVKQYYVEVTKPGWISYHLNQIADVN